MENTTNIDTMRNVIIDHLLQIDPKKYGDVDYSKLKVFYHCDDDGKLAAFIVSLLTKNTNPDCYIECDYGNSIVSPDLVNEGDQVFIVDLSFTKDNYQTLFDVQKKAGTKIHWWDHHTSSLNIVYDIMKDIDTIDYQITSSMSGAMIALYNVSDLVKNTIDSNNFELVFEPINDYIDSFGHMRDGFGNKAKNLVLYTYFIDDYDRWVHEDSRSNHIHYYLMNRSKLPFNTDWNKICFTNTRSASITGAGYEGFLCYINGKNFENYGYMITLCNHTCLVYNGAGNSSLFGGAYEKYKLAIRFIFDGEMYRYSIYSSLPDIQCDKIAERFGGGGHKGAAGFSSDKLLFLKDCSYDYPEL